MSNYTSFRDAKNQVRRATEQINNTLGPAREKIEMANALIRQAMQPAVESLEWFWDDPPAKTVYRTPSQEKRKPDRREPSEIELPPGKPGPKSDSRAEKIEWRAKWNEDKQSRTITLERWLFNHFGTHENGDPRVPRSTFYSWPTS